jgi:hypothetical protein
MRFDAAAVRASSGTTLLRRGRGALSRWVRPALDPHAPTGLLTAEQTAALRGLTEVVATGEAIPDAEWEPVRAALVAAALERPGFRALCSRACRLLDGLDGRRFADMSLDERTACVVAARLAVRPVPAAELLLVGRRVQHEIRELLVPELIRAYFDAPAGWAVVGYDVALGECRDPFAYTARPA